MQQKIEIPMEPKWWQTNKRVEAGGAYSCKLCGDTVALRAGATFPRCARDSTPTAWFGPKPKP
jgi:hypothetical protein